MTTLVEEKEQKARVTRDVTSLRKALEFLEAEGDVLTTDAEVDPDLEITGLQKHLDGGPVLMFNHVKGKPHARAITSCPTTVSRQPRLPHAHNAPPAKSTVMWPNSPPKPCAPR